MGDLFVDELDELAKWLRSLLTVVPDYRGFALLQHEGNFGSLALSLARSDVDAWDDRIGSAVDQLDALTRKLDSAIRELTVVARELDQICRAAIAARPPPRPKRRPRKEEERR